MSKLTVTRKASASPVVDIVVTGGNARNFLRVRPSEAGAVIQMFSAAPALDANGRIEGGKDGSQILVEAQHIRELGQALLEFEFPIRKEVK